MKKISILLFITVMACSLQAQYISEIDYNTPGGGGSETGEFIEVFFPTGTNPSNFSLYLYNGNNGNIYGGSPINLAPGGNVTCTINGTGQLCVWAPPGPNAIRNQDPNGVLL